MKAKLILLAAVVMIAIIVMQQIVIKQERDALDAFVNAKHLEACVSYVDVNGKESACFAVVAEPPQKAKP